MKRFLSTVAIVLAAAGTLDAQTVRHDPAFETNSIPANDDGSSGLESLGFTINLFGKIRTAVYVNNNGNVTFDSPLPTFTPFGLDKTEREIIAPFFSDVDTRGTGSKLVTYGQGMVNGRRAFVANYVNVGYYNTHVDKTNSFQVVLIDRSDHAAGDFDIEFNYDRIAWETGDASQGVGGLGGVSAAVGWSNGTDTSYQLPGSLVPGSFLDGGPHSLVSQSITGSQLTGTNAPAGTPGRLVFRARDGVISPGVVISGGQLPDATLNTAYSATLSVDGADPPFRWTMQPDVAPLPGLAFSSAGVITGTPTAAGTYGFTVGVTAESEDGEITVYERATLTVRPATLHIVSTCPVPDAYVGSPYSFQFAATGSSSLNWSIQNRGDIPAGLGLSSGGLLAGTPQQAGSAILSVQVQGPDGSIPAQTMCRLNVNPAAVGLSGCSLPRATVGVPFTQILQPSGGIAPYRFDLLGNLPQGMALMPDGSIIGTPNTWGVWLFKVATTDAAATRNEQDCALQVDPAKFTPSVCPLPSAVTGIPYSTNLGSKYTWSLIGSLPGGLTLTPDGKISGTPMTAGGAQFALLATDGAGNPSSEACSLVVTRGPLGLSGCPLPSARVGLPFSAAVIGFGGNAPYLFSQVAGNLPSGLTLSSSGAITGTPDTSGKFDFSIRLRDSQQSSAIQACEIQVQPPDLKLTSSCPLPDAHVGEAYSQKLVAAGGQAPYQFTYGLLPDGLTGAADGSISGRPTRLGGGSFSIAIADAVGDHTDNVCSVAVSSPNVPAISLVDPPATVSAATTNLPLTVQLASAYTAPVQGQITLSITPATAGTDPVVDTADPLLAFGNGQRTASFTIPAGATRASVPLVSTGTVASDVLVALTNLQASGAPIVQSPSAKVFRVAPTGPSVNSVCYVRTLTDRGVTLEFRATGTTSTRELTNAQITVPGLELFRPQIPVPSEFVFDPTNTVTVDLSDTAFGFFSSPVNVRTGGGFSLSIPLPLDAQPTYLPPETKISGVTLALLNKIGSSGVQPVAACQ